VGTRDSALDKYGVAGLRRAAADRDLAHVVLGCRAGPPLGPCNIRGRPWVRRPVLSPRDVALL
jgi:hypothetical protein